MALSIGGLGSGLDTASIVQQLMQAEAIPQNQLKAARSAVTVKAAAWTTLSGLMTTLKAKADAISAPDKLRLTSTASSAPTSVTATSDPSALPGSVSLRVERLASRAQLASTAGFASGSAAVGTGSLVVSSGTAALGARVQAGDTATTGTYALVISRTAPSAAPTATVNGQPVAFTAGPPDPVTGAATTRLEVGGATLTFRADDVRTGSATLGVAATGADGATLSELAAKLAGTSGPATAAAVDTGTGSTPVKLVLTATQSGAKGRLEVSASSGLSGLSAYDTLRQGENAVLALGDPSMPLRVQRSDNTVSDLLPGTTLTLLKADPAVEVTVSVSRDPEAVVVKVRALTEAVNGVMSWVRTNSTYDVATRKGGPMVGESAVRSLPGTLVAAAGTGQAQGSYQVPGQLGLSPTRTGELALDETKLRAALAADPDAVSSLVAGLSAALAKVADDAAKTGGAVKTGQDAVASRTKDLTTRIDAWDSRLLAVQARYQRQFSALDVALSKMNSQSSWLAGQIGSLPKG